MHSPVISKRSKKGIPETTSFSGLLLKWYAEHARSYPWIGIKDPYLVWLSEIILQQTRVEQGLPYYEKIAGRYPTVCDLARAPEQEVFRLWQGLGYYNRCKNMLAAARMICESFGGVFPQTYDEILELPGVGPYTAAAIASFAFDLPRAVVDGNVERVLARYFEIATPVNTGAGKKQFGTLAAELLDCGAPARYNQAIMDFGATVCLPRQPRCTQCPLQKGCAAYARGTTALFPVKKPKKPAVRRYLHYYVFQHHDRLYIRKRPQKGIWQNLHEFVLYESHQQETEKTLLQTPLFKEITRHNSLLNHFFSPAYVHKLTHQSLHIRFLVIRLKKPPVLPEEYFAIDRKDPDLFAFPKPLVQFLKERF